MKRSVTILIAAILITGFGICTTAQTQLTTTITSRTHDQSYSTGRDFWLAAPSNNWGAAPGIIQIYISSSQRTTAYVELGNSRNSILITPYAISSFTIPATWEMESSGVVESKAIHVYSNDADLSVCFFSQQSIGTGEGTNILPTIGWGKDYVVAAFASLFEVGTDTPYDYPSECVVVAGEDNTSVTITPVCNCRECMAGNENGNADASVTIFPAGKSFTIGMDRGQSFQLMPVLATGPDNFDMTGTIIHANNPIGVMGGSSETNIPLDHPYANFVCEMIPPVSTWGESYYTTNFTNAPNQTALYLFIGTQAGQTIYGHNCTTNDYVVTSLSDANGVYWDEIAGAHKFWSDAPFLVVSYINNQGFGSGSPAEVAINPREHYPTSEIFQVLQPPAGEQLTFVNYANIIVNDSDAKNIFFDGKSINGNPSQCIDNNWEMFVISHIGQGVHTISGDDSGVGVYVYGSRAGESYAWSCPEFEGVIHSPDSTAPHVDTIVECYKEYVHFNDSSNSPNSIGAPIVEIRLDSLSNIAYVRDTNFADGIPTDTASYLLTVTDPTKPAILVITAFNAAGNSTTVRTVYVPNIITMKPLVRNMGVSITGNPPNSAYDTIYNVGQTPFDLTELHLKYGDVGFSLHDSSGGTLDLSPIGVGDKRIIQIQFLSVKTTAVVDSIIFGNDCELQAVAVIGSGGASDFTVSSQSWPDEPLGNCYPKTVQIENLSTTAITIDSAWWQDTLHFKAASTFPITVPASPGTVQFTIDYCPDSASAISPNRTQGNWYSPQVLETGGSDKSPRFDSLVGWAATPSSVSDGNASKNATIIPTNDGHSLEIVLPSTINFPVAFELVNVLGESALYEIFFDSIHTINSNTLPRGMYFYKLTSGQWSQSGKVILGE